LTSTCIYLSAACINFAADDRVQIFPG